MTNLEKFQEVFGITIDDRFIRSSTSSCRGLDFIGSSDDKCINFESCCECPLSEFWDKEYVEKA